MDSQFLPSHYQNDVLPHPIHVANPTRLLLASIRYYPSYLAPMLVLPNIVSSPSAFLAASPLAFLRVSSPSAFLVASPLAFLRVSSPSAFLAASTMAFLRVSSPSAFLVASPLAFPC